MSRFFLPVFYTVLQLLIIMAVGFGLRRYSGWKESFFITLNRFIRNILLPVYIFIAVSGADVESLRRAWIFPVAAVIIVAAGLAFSWPLFRLLPFDRQDRRAGMAFSAFGNSGYMPISIIEFLPVTLPFISRTFGVETPLMFVGAYLIPMTPLLWAMGNYLISGHTAKPSFRDIVSPPMYGVIAGFVFVLAGGQSVLTNMSLPFVHIYTALEKIGFAVLPLVLISLGAAIGGLEIEKGMKRKMLLMVGGVSLVRFVLLPGLFFLIYFFVLRPIGASPVQVWVLFLVSVTPPAMNLSVMALHAGVNKNYTAVTLLVTYLFYLIVFPVYLVLLFMLPGMPLFN